MVLESPNQVTQEFEASLISLITDKKLTAIQMMSEILEVTPEVVSSTIKKLLEEGLLNGTLTEDETRFFNSYTKVSRAPVIPTNEREIVVFEGNSMPGKIAVITGIFMLISGSITRGLTLDSYLNFDAMGTAVAMVGLVVLIAGMMYIGKQNPL